MTILFDRFVGIDWSGARGVRHTSIQLASITLDGNAVLIQPPAKGAWSRQGVLDFLTDEAIRKQQVLVGLDCNFAFPFLDRGQYLPGMPGTPRSFWRAIDTVCTKDPDLSGHGFLKKQAHHFLRPDDRGSQYAPRRRVVETCIAKQALGRPETVFKLIGPSQVGLGALAGMRLLYHLKLRLGKRVAVWPFEAAEAPLVMVEAFPRAYIRMAGLGQRKLRTSADLSGVLAHFGAKAEQLPVNMTDDMSDALVTAAALRRLSQDSHVWRPKSLSARVRAKEGWVFGVA